ncbi:MAG TPA: hypothetical protein VEC38_15175 [Candidatus Binataceae bacterium]|nr:hypothetical protein [Candidatus Binataceae bacterium]
MATLVDAPEFTANEIYEIQATDPVEGAASGASFGGVGISNQPHQQLANRSAFLKGRQDTNIANIAALQAFTVLFSGARGPNGYLKIPYDDVNAGANQVLMVQWGTLSIPGTIITGDTRYSITFPTAFPNLCYGVISANLYKKTAGANTVASPVSGSINTSGFTVVFDVSDGIAEAAGGSVHETTDGAFWIAIGY